MKNLLRDVRFGARMLRKNPGFSLAAVAVLALGIGANTAIFSLVNAFLIKPLVIQNPSELVGCFSREVRRAQYRGFSYPEYADVRENGSVFSNLAAHNMAMIGISEGDSTRRAFADIVSANYFATFGVPLFRGRPFTADEERPASAIPVVIVSYAYWKKTGADPQQVGKPLRINARIYNVVGITAEGFTGTSAMLSPEVYLPLGDYELATNDFEGHGRELATRDNHALILVGRLRPGTSQAAADAHLATVAAQLAKAYPERDQEQTFQVRPLARMGISTEPQSDSGLLVPAGLLLAVAGVVLLIASLNITNMMLARGTTRGKEIAIRVALGGSRGAILRQLLVESFLLALCGGIGGLAIAYWSTDLLVRSLARLAPVDIVYTAGPDLRVLAATIGFCLLSTVVFGFGPAWNLSGRSLFASLKIGDRADFTAGKVRGLFVRRNLLVMGQIALSLMLLSAAGLFIRSSVQAAKIQPGFRMDGELLAEVDASLAGYDEPRGREVYRAVLERLQNTPGVESVGLAATVPFGMISLGKTVQKADETGAAGPTGKGSEVSCRYNVVSDDYFTTMGVPLLTGETFTAANSGKANRVVVVLNHAAAQELWSARPVVGKHVRLTSGAGEDKPLDAEVIGVVGDVQDSVTGKQVSPAVYAAFRQAYQSDMNIHLKIAAKDEPGEARMLETVRKQILAVDPNLPLVALKSMRVHVDSSFDLWIVRTGARMFVTFGGVALLLAAIGLYGVRAYTVATRTREIGIRMALGARASDALGMMLREGMILMGIGAAAGSVLSLAVGKLLSGMLYRVPSFDPLVLSAAPATLAAVALIACYIPARRAARVDPMVALRDE